MKHAALCYSLCDRQGVLMKIKDLISKLQNANPESTVWIINDNHYYDFTGMITDDDTDIQLFVSIGDKKA